MDKFLDYKTSADPIFYSEYSDKLQMQHPHVLLTYMFNLLLWPSVLSKNIVPGCNNLHLSQTERSAVFKSTHTKALEESMLGFDNDPVRNSLTRAMAFGRPELVEDIRTQLWNYTAIPGTAFNSVKAKGLLRFLQSQPQCTPDGGYYEFEDQPYDGHTQPQLAAMALGKSLKTPKPARAPRPSDSIWKVDCEFVRHSIPLRAHIHEINQKQRLSWCKLAPEV
eukprot:NODE_1937_length_804_cov_83.849007_g1535_i0.p1 GENE.NODE_1937_length_804_cov_83.849007_g1535_i0~~NODE_1937_length_804_cov_83.849007_g1535_i0.p1  ORF type:complete len:222 (+),score=36.19 NODE_1937_length_804_cov_83.849007_g1535_i0:67-732(+)